MGDTPAPRTTTTKAETQKKELLPSSDPTVLTRRVEAPPGFYGPHGSPTTITAVPREAPGSAGAAVQAAPQTATTTAARPAVVTQSEEKARMDETSHGAPRKKRVLASRLQIGGGTTSSTGSGLSIRMGGR